VSSFANPKLYIIMKTTQEFLKLKQRARDGHGVPPQVLNYHEGLFVLLKYPNRPPNKLAGLYRDLLVIEGIIRPDKNSDSLTRSR
jgi:hypothetical protein